MKGTCGRGKSNKCNQCGNEFSNGSNLRKRVKIHTEDKTNKCNQSDYASYEAGNLRNHLKTHSGEKTKKCNQCDFASCFAVNLKKHLRTHIGDKSNKCNQCVFACTDPSSLRKLPKNKAGFFYDIFPKCGWVGWLIPKQGPNPSKPPQIAPKIAFFDPNFTLQKPWGGWVGKHIWERYSKKNGFSLAASLIKAAGD